jgi:exodeoxyribonuclease VII small subunit
MAKETISYNEAISEIEEILTKIEEGELDVDELTENVKRVTRLLQLCRDKLHQTEQDVTAILGGEKDQKEEDAE